MIDLATVNFQYLEDSLCNTSGNVQLAERFRSLFTLKNIANDQAIDIIAKGKIGIQYNMSVVFIYT